MDCTRDASTQMLERGRPGLVLRLVTGIALGAAAAAASSYERSHYFAPLASNEALAQGTVNALLQDRSGFLWIATQGGLHRHDGKELVGYQHQPDVAGSLPENFITALAETEDGRLYVGSARRGLVYLDRSQGRFVPVLTSPDRAQRRASVTDLHSQRGGGLWVGSRFGLELFAADGTRRDLLKPVAGEFPEVNRISECPDGSVLAATMVGGYVIAAKSFNATKVPFGANPAYAGAALCARDGTRWFGVGRTLVRLTKSGVAEDIWRADESRPHAEIMDIAEDASGQIWLAVHRDGVLRLNPADRSSIHLHHDERMSGSLPEDTMRRVLIDRSGLLWVGGDVHGLSYSDPAGAAFGHLFDQDADGRDQMSNHVRALLADDDRGLWIGTDGDGLKHYDFAQQAFTSHRTALLAILAPDKPEAALRVHALRHAENATLWVATQLGLVRYDPQSGQGTRLAIDAGRGDVPSDQDTRALALGADGSLWIGTWSAGVVKYTPDLGRSQHFSDGAATGTPGLWHPTVFALHEDRSGRVWIGTLAGLNVYERATGSMHRIPLREGDNEGLTGNVVRSIRETGDGGIWIGTDSGLNQLLSYEGGRARFRSYLVSDGLANDTIYGVLDDDEGRIWASTNRGISMLDTRQKVVRNFVARDGLQGLEFNGNAQVRLPDGRLVFGGTRGVNWVKPAAIALSSYVPPLAFTSLQIGSRRERIDDPGRFKEVQLAADDRVLMLSFAALDLAAPERNRYRYRLRGYDDAWVDLGARHEVSFTNLAPGSYVLEVLGSNRDGVFGSEPLTAAVRVAPAWWQTWAARVLFVATMLLGGLAYVVHRRRMHNALREQHAQLKLYSDRLSLALWASRDGFWDWDIRNATIYLSGPEELVGADRESTVSYDTWRDRVVHPEDRDRVMAALEAHVSGERDHYESEYRVLSKHRKVIWIVARGRATERDANGRAVHVAGTFRDVSLDRDRDRDRRIAQEVIRCMGEAVTVTGLDFRFSSINAAFSRITGYADHEVIGIEANILNSDQHPPEFYRELRETIVRAGTGVANCGNDARMASSSCPGSKFPRCVMPVVPARIGLP